MKYSFNATSVVVDATTPEEAVNKVSSRLSQVARYLGSGVALSDNKPFFTLTTVDDSTAATDLSDPLHGDLHDAVDSGVTVEPPAPADDGGDTK